MWTPLIDLLRWSGTPWFAIGSDQASRTSTVNKFTFTSHGPPLVASTFAIIRYRGVIRRGDSSFGVARELVGWPTNDF